MMISNKKNLATTLWWIIGVSLTIHLLSFIAGKTVLQNWQFIHEALHSSIEMSGSVIAVLVAIFLVIYEHGNRGTNFNIQIAAALISMGLLDGIHACVQTGNTLVWVHSIATFIGGFFFVLIWLPKNGKFFQSFKWFLVALIISLGIGIYSILFPDTLPLMVQHGQFSLYARLLNISGGILLFFSALRIVQEYFHSRNPDDLLFCLHCTLFGIAAIMFEYSVLWDAPWWSWHLLRFAAYIVALWFIILSERRTFSELLKESFERKQVESKLKLFNKSLEQRVLERTEELSRANNEIVDSEYRFRLMAEAIPEVFWMTSPDFKKMIYVSPSYEIIWDRTCKSLYEHPKSWMENIDPDDRDRIISAIDDCVNGKAGFVEEYRIIRPDGSTRWILDRAFSTKKHSGSVNYIIGIARDVTTQKKNEESISKKNSYLKLLQVAAVAANEAEDIKDAFLPVLKEICNYTGWEIGHAYVIAEDNPDLLIPTEVWCIEDQKQFMEFCNVTKEVVFARDVGLPGRVLSSSKPHWIVDVTRDNNFYRKEIALDLNIKSGIAFPVMVGVSVVAVLEFFTTKIQVPDQRFMDIMADVGTQLGRVFERKQAEEALRESFELNKKILSESPIGLVIYDQTGKCIEANMSIAEMINATQEQVLAQNYNNIKSWKESGLLDAANRSMRLQVNERAEFKVITTFGRHAFFDCTFVPFVSNGQPHLLLIFDEITKRKQMEVALVQSEKMKAMGIMASGVAHEFNNILAVISSNAQLLEETHSGDNELMSSLRTICRMSDDGAEIVNRMYEFTNIRKDTSHYINIELNDLIEQVISFTMPRWKDIAQANGINYKIGWDADKTLPSVLGNQTELREVVLNIINNALDAMPGGGTVTVETHYIWIDAFGFDKDKDKGLYTQNSRSKSKFVEIIFKDNGSGMTDEIKNRMFDPFFTTKGTKGTGLGMSISYGIITRHGGEIVVQSKPGFGTKIKLRLPISVNHVNEVVESKHNDKLKFDSLNVLVVDDSKEMCDSLSELFTDEGQRVLSVDNGAEAVKLLKENSYDLLLCDLVMPDINGKDVVNAINKMKKKTKVGMITGWDYSMEDAEKDGLQVDFIARKPFDLSVLRRNINDLWS